MSGLVCRGSYVLGSACGKCARCESDPMNQKNYNPHVWPKFKDIGQQPANFTQPTNEDIARRLDLVFCKLDRVENELNKLSGLLKGQVI